MTEPIYKTKKVTLPEDRAEIMGIQKHPEHLCKDCRFMTMQGGGASYQGAYEWYFQACERMPTDYGLHHSVDPIMDGPDDEVSTSIISECTDYQKVQS